MVDLSIVMWVYQRISPGAGFDLHVFSRRCAPRFRRQEKCLSSVQLSDMAGNAFTAQICLAAFLTALAVVDPPGVDWRSRDIQDLTFAPMIMSVYIYIDMYIYICIYIYVYIYIYTFGYVYRYWIKQIVDNSKSLMLIALHLARAKYTLRFAPAA